MSAYRKRFAIVDGVFTEITQDSRVKTIAKWPVLSDAAGCNPDHIPETRAALSAAGVPTDFTRDGQAIFTGPKHRRDACRVMGLFDRNAGYSDPQARNL